MSVFVHCFVFLSFLFVFICLDVQCSVLFAVISVLFCFLYFVLFTSILSLFVVGFLFL